MDIKTIVCAILLVCAYVEAGRGGGGRISGGGSRSRGSSSTYSRPSYSSSSHSSSHYGSSADAAARRPPTHTSHPQPKPQPQPNHDNTRLSYGNNEPHTSHGTQPQQTANKPAPKPNEEHTKLSYGEQSQQAKHQPSAPPMEHSGNQQGAAKPPPYAANPPPYTPTNQNPPPPPYSATNPHAPSAPPAPIGFNVPNQRTNVQGTNSQPPGLNTQQNANGQSNIGWNVPGSTGNTQAAKPGQAGWNANNPSGGTHDTVNRQQVGGQQNTPGGVYNTPHGQTHVAPNQNGYYPNTGGYQPQQGGGYHPYPQQQYHNGNGYQQGYGGYGYHPSGGYGGGYHAPPSYNPPGTNIHYGPVTYINGHASPPAYHYYHDTSDHSLLSLYVGYKIGQMFSYNSFHNHGYHESNTYVIHHYHDNKKSDVPQNITLQGDTIVGCKDSTLICLSNTLPVCLSNGTIFCVTAPQQTIPCAQNANMQCVQSVINCTQNAQDPACNGTTTGGTNTATLSVPCISSVNIFGDITANLSSINATAISIDATKDLTSTLAENKVLCVTVIAVPTPVNATVANATNIDWEKVGANQTAQFNATTSPLISEHPHVIASNFLKNFLLHIWS